MNPHQQYPSQAPPGRGYPPQQQQPPGRGYPAPGQPQQQAPGRGYAQPPQGAQPGRGYPSPQQQAPGRGYPTPSPNMPPRQTSGGMGPPPPTSNNSRQTPPPQQQQQQQARGYPMRQPSPSPGNTAGAPNGRSPMPRGYPAQQTPQPMANGGGPPRPSPTASPMQMPGRGYPSPGGSNNNNSNQPPASLTQQMGGMSLRPGTGAGASSTPPPRPPMQHQQQPPQRPPSAPATGGPPPRPGMGMSAPPRPGQAPPFQQQQQQPPPPQQQFQQQQQQPPPPRPMQQHSQPPSGQQFGGGMQQGMPPPPQQQQQQQPPPPQQFGGMQQGMPPPPQHQGGMHQQQQHQMAPPQQGQYGQRQMPPMQGMQQPPQQQQMPGRPQPPQPILDPSFMCDKAWLDPTMSKFPASSALSEQSALPLGCVLQPLAEHPEGKEPPVVNFGSVGVVRCRACRAYINPFVLWLENGRRWKCNLCNRENETGSQYYSHLDADGQRADRMQHPELSEGCIEIMAPSEYMVRPPQAPVYMFVLDVSFEAVQSGMLATAVKAIQESLDELPGAPRTQVGLITYDYAVHFYSLNSGLSQPKMFVVSDLDELFLPCPEDLLVNLADSREVFEMLLDSLPRIHAKSQTHDIASGSAIQAAYRVMVHIGGKMVVFQSKLPTLGRGKLAHRENVRLLGTDKEHTLFQPADAFYQNTVNEMGKNQVSIELFLAPTAYCDAASLHALAKSTGGQLHFFPRFTSQRHGQAFAADVRRTLTRETAWEAVLRLRASHGVRVSGFHGNFQLRGTDLMQLPTCDADATYALEFRHQDKMVTSGVITLQGALLYTNSNGQRRIRVLTTVIPVTSTVSDLHASANQDAIAAFIAKKASSEAFSLALPQVRAKMQQFCVNVLRASKSSMNSIPYGQPPSMMMPQQQQQQHHQQQGQQLPECMSLLPLYAMAMIKSPAFRGGEQVGFDERINFLHAVNRMSRANVTLFLYPRLYELHSMTPDCGRPVAVPANNNNGQSEAGTLRFGENQRIKLPRLVNLSAGCLNSAGVFLLDNGLELLLWVGRGVDPRLVQALFGVPTLDGIDGGVLRVERQPDDNDIKQRTCNILDALRASSTGTFQQIQVIKEGDPLEARFRWFLVEDRASFTGGSFSYDEFINNCQRLSTQAPQR